MADPNKMYLRKIFNNQKDELDSNAVFTLLTKHEDFSTFKRIDTISLEEEIVALTTEELNNNFYTVKEFLDTAKKVNKVGYYKGMSELEMLIYETFIVLYQNKYHILVYDTLADNIVLTPAKYPEEDFIEFESKNIKNDEKTSRILKKK